MHRSTLCFIGLLVCACGGGDDGISDPLNSGGPIVTVCEPDEPPTGVEVEFRQLFLPQECWTESAQRDSERAPLVVNVRAELDELLRTDLACSGDTDRIDTTFDFEEQRLVVYGYLYNTDVRRVVDAGDNVVIETVAFLSGALAERGHLVVGIPRSEQPLAFRRCAEHCTGGPDDCLFP